MPSLAQPLPGLIWLLLMLGPFLFLENKLHREVQILFLLITKRYDITVVIFSLLFLPGVFLHELSHYVAAKLLRVYTGRFSVTPKVLGDGSIQMGFVEVERVDWLRESLIGAAPMLTGGLFVAYAGLVKLHLGELWTMLLSGNAAEIMDLMVLLPQRADFWLWLYLTVTVSSMMMPSESDRRAWLPLGLIIVVLFALALWAGAGGWLQANLAPWLDEGFRSISGVLAASGLVHLIILFPTVLLRRLASSVTGREVR